MLRQPFLSAQLRNIKLQRRKQMRVIQFLPPLFIWTWFILLAEDSPLYVMVDSVLSQQGDIAVRFILPKEMAYFSPQGLLRKETSSHWGGDSILALSPCQHPFCKRRTQNEVVSPDWRVFFYSRAGPNMINHILRHMHGSWSMGWPDWISEDTVRNTGASWVCVGIHCAILEMLWFNSNTV